MAPPKRGNKNEYDIHNGIRYLSPCESDSENDDIEEAGHDELEQEELISGVCADKEEAEERQREKDLKHRKKWRRL